MGSSDVGCFGDLSQGSTVDAVKVGWHVESVAIAKFDQAVEVMGEGKFEFARCENRLQRLLDRLLGVEAYDRIGDAVRIG